jgi:hypothetical protein
MLEVTYKQYILSNLHWDFRFQVSVTGSPSRPLLFLPLFQLTRLRRRNCNGFLNGSSSHFEKYSGDSSQIFMFFWSSSWTVHECSNVVQISWKYPNISYYFWTCSWSVHELFKFFELFMNTSKRQALRRSRAEHFFFAASAAKFFFRISRTQSSRVPWRF